MNYHHQFEVKAPLAAVVDFHRQAASMGAITPPPVVVRVHSAPPFLQDGDEMAFTLWLGPLPIHWRARIELLPEAGFIDRQMRGPFAKWEHRHTFVQVDAQTTTVIDEVTAEPSRHWFWKLVGLGMWLNMPFLFAFRGWKTRRLLEAQAKKGVHSTTSSLS
jgi:ligand-binding SRPBCC domain-containing protein